MVYPLPVLLVLSTLSASDIRVLLVTGGHDHPVSFYSVFQDAPGLKVNVMPHPQALSGDLRKRYDVLVFYDMIKAGLDERKRANLRAFAEAGKGILVLHHALCSHGDWPWWYEELTGARWIEPGAAGLPASTYKEDLDLEIAPVAKDHPVLAGIDKPFHIVDETYGKLWFSPKIEVLLRTTHATSDGPVAWVGPWRRSRVLTIQLGHGAEAHHNSNFRQLVRNAIQWVAAQPTPDPAKVAGQ